uniref:Uncharacterized protein LOC108950821 n=1 Tax=Phallusia mammillata TaxID=59560 RepID=A0A6F9DJY3_9ASCI|nr:uncharacterized protein LOC108950821 [Phallusia mammillata]
MTAAVIEEAKAWKEQRHQYARHSKDSTSKKARKLVWATQFPALLRLSDKEKVLKPNCMVTYKRPPSLQELFLCPRKLALGRLNHCAPSGCYPCGRCALCGNHGSHKIGMVKCSAYLQTSMRRFKISQHLTCRSYGIYVATCLLCHEQYVGQTKNRFATRWSGHRAIWAKFDTSQRNDGTALLHHFKDRHPNEFAKKTPMESCYCVAFVEQPRTADLDLAEDRWLNKIDAKINIKKMVLPRCK